MGLIQPQVSLIIACYNKQEYILQSVEAVLGQSFKDLELVIVDDNSTDLSVEMVRTAMLRDERVKLIVNKENKGANFCRNSGIKAATGRYIIFYDADDVLAKDCIARRVDFMTAHPQLDFAVFTMQVFRQVPGDSAYTWNPSVKQPLVDFLSHDLPWQTMQPIWKKEFVEKLGGFDESFRRLQDVELHTRALLSEKVKFLLISAAPDCFYRIDESRKNFNAFNFMNRWVSSAVKYCDKFNVIVPVHLRRFLPGTLFKTYLQILNAYKTGKLKKNDFLILESLIVSHTMIKGSYFRKSLFMFSRLYNLHFFRIPGINKLVHKMVLSGL